VEQVSHAPCVPIQRYLWNRRRGVGRSDTYDPSRNSQYNLNQETRHVQPGTRLGPYEIVAPIGAGGMGEVYRARDTRLGRDVAIKVLPEEFADDPERLRRFEQEAKAVAALDHPNILAIHDVGTHEAIPYLVTELLEGESLRDRLRAGGLTVRKAVETAVQIAQGLAAAHEKGIVHRDLKPANVFITKQGIVKILDFGIAKLVAPTSVVEPAQASTVVEATEPGTTLGTVGYMSPEQVRCQSVDHRTDIFSFGCVLYEMLSGGSPFRRDTAADTTSAILHDEPPGLAGTVRNIPPAIEGIVNRCLEKRPEDRFSSAHDLALALLAASSQGETAPPTRAGPSVAGLERRWLWTGIAALGVIAVAAVAVYVFTVRGHAGAPTAAGPIRSIAVLPLTNLSGDPAQDYFSDGMTEELIATLSKISALKVISRTSVMQFKGSKKPLREIAAVLGVEGVIEGSVLRAGERVRITAQLINAATDTHLWAESYDRDLKDVLALQSDVARAVAGEVRAKLTPPEHAQLASARPVNPEAYEACMKGRFHWYKLSREELDTAERYFKAALDSDPNYALAYEGLSRVWLSRTDAGFQSPAEAIPQARAAAQRALELDDTLAEAHLVSAFVKGWDRDWPGAEREYRRSIQLNPNSAEAHFFYADFLVTMRRTDEWRAEIQRWLELDPLDFFFQTFYGWHLVYERRYDEAIGQLNKVLAVEPDFSSAHMGLWGAFYKKGMDAQALAEAKKFFAVLHDSEVVEALDRGYAGGGYCAAMKRAGETLAARSERSYVSAVRIARVFAHAGENDRALDFLEKALGRNENALVHIGVGWDWDALRPNPRYRAILRRMNLPSK
jgi:serine/threonine protein kinase/TolB-like protein